MLHSNPTATYASEIQKTILLENYVLGISSSEKHIMIIMSRRMISSFVNRKNTLNV